MAKKTDDLEAVRLITAALESFGVEEQERIIRWAREKLGHAPDSRNTPGTSAARASAPSPTPDPIPTPQPVAPGSLRDLKTFVSEKGPRSDVQFAATVAYFYRFEAPLEQRRNDIDAALLQDACRLASRKRLKRPLMTLTNAKNQGVLDKTAEVGRYAINSVGENLVAMTLPGQTEGAASRAGSRKARRNEPTRRKK
jgi:hypothetical protein